MLALLSEKAGQLKKPIQGARRDFSGGGLCKSGRLRTEKFLPTVLEMSTSLGMNWERALLFTPCVAFPETPV